MSYVTCLDCGKEKHIEKIAKQNGIDLTAKILMDTKLAGCYDKDMVEFFNDISLTARLVK